MSALVRDLDPGDAAWFTWLTARALVVVRQARELGEPVWYHSGKQVDFVSSVGGVSTHTDTAYPRYSYLLVVYDDAGSNIRAGRRQINCKIGCLIELDIHQPHALRQPKDNKGVWVAAAIDSPLQRSLDDVFDEFVTRCEAGIAAEAEALPAGEQLAAA